MILGIILVVLFVILCLLPLISKKQKSPKRKKITMKLHCYLSIGVTVLTAIHLLLTLSFFKQRPIGMYVSGVIMFLCMVAACIGNRRKISRRIHGLLSLVILIFLCIHIYFGVSSFNQYQNTISGIRISQVDLSTIEDGTYEGECDAGYIYAKVRVYVTDGVIVNIEILEHRNEKGSAAEQIVNSIMELQSLDVDAITSATNSSEVIKKAVENALLGR